MRAFEKKSLFLGQIFMLIPVFMTYSRNVYGKLCFGHEEMNQFSEAEKTGAIALEHTPNDIWAIHSIAHIKEETLR